MLVISTRELIYKQKHQVHECNLNAMQCNNKLPTSCYWLEQSLMRVLRNHQKEINSPHSCAVCFPLFEKESCLPWLRLFSHHFNSEQQRKTAFARPPVNLLRSCISTGPLPKTTPTHDNKWTMRLSDASVWFICKTKTFHAPHSRCPSWSPSGGEHIAPVPARPWLTPPPPTHRVAPICMHTAFLTEHSTQARRNEEKKTTRERPGNKILFLW